MSTRFVSIGRNQALLLPPDLRDWVPEDDLVHFVIHAVEGLPDHLFRVNVRGTGSAQYPPSVMLALLVYCYANGIFSSRRIERATYRDVSVRYLTANTHPDHDTIATFRRENFDAVAACFVRVLELAREAGLLRVGSVSVDGTKLRANASINRNVRYDRAGHLIEQLTLEVKELMEKAERADVEEASDGQQLPEALSRREKLKAKLEEARNRIEARARAKAEAEQAEYEEKLRKRENSPTAKHGREPQAPDPTPEPDTQQNLTDPDSRLMRKNLRIGFEQSYNAQAAVDADGSQLILGTRVSTETQDRNELVPTVEAIPRVLGSPSHVLADNGYLNRIAGQTLEAQGMELYIACGAEGGRRQHDFRPELPPREPKQQDRCPWKIAMRAKLKTEEGRRRYRVRKHTVEPVFGIIKDALGFRRFTLRGLANVTAEWQL
ncbi:IS1182 family transposase, partial [Candidatus Kaiserbacteria bacterium]|nr:IS1182 family transposase [Candidatus Kaiserbacteria bacterium]